MYVKCNTQEWHENIWGSKTFKIQCARVEFNELAKELNARYKEAVSHWNITGRMRNGPLAELKSRAHAAFSMKLNFTVKININFVSIVNSFSVNSFKTSKGRM